MLVVLALTLSSCRFLSLIQQQLDARSMAEDASSPVLSLDLGVMEILDPDPDDLADVYGVGLAPVDQVWLYMADGFGRIDAEALQQVDLALPNIALECEDTNIFEMVDPTMNANYDVKDVQCCGVTLASLARPYQMIGLRDAWAMVAGSGLPQATVRVGVLDQKAWATTPEFKSSRT